MRRYLLDTGIAGDYMNRRHGVDTRARIEVARGNKLGIGVPVLAELFYGVEKSATRNRNMLLLRRTIPAWKIWPFEKSTAEIYGSLVAHLDRIGRPMQRIDIMVAAIALDLGNCTVVSADSDLLAIPGLTVENWATP